MKCEWRPPGKKKGKPCGLPASTFVIGAWRCSGHVPTPHPNCTHSLIGTDRCALCGAKVGATKGHQR